MDLIMEMSDMKPSKSYFLRTALTLVILIPYIFGFSPNPADSSSTTIGIAAGGGSYAEVSRDCNGRVLDVKNYPFNDVGISVDHKISLFDIGVKGGIASINTSEGEGTLRYVNPTMGINTAFLGLQMGPLFTNDFGGEFFTQKGVFGGSDYYGYYNGSYNPHYTKVYPAGSLRLGFLDKWYFTTGFYDNLPIISGGGLFNMGIGFHTGIHPASRLWFGIGGLPFDGAVFSGKGDIPLTNNVILNLQGNFHAGDATEYTLSAGTKFVIR